MEPNARYFLSASTSLGRELDELLLIFGVENVPSSNVLTEMTPISEWRQTEPSTCSGMLAFLLCYTRLLAGAVGSQQVQRETTDKHVTPPNEDGELRQLKGPLVAGCGAAHKPLPLHVNRWDIAYVK